MGWSPGAARRNVAFLRSVDERELTGHGYAFTLTVRKCPSTSEDWTKCQRAWIERQRRAGLIRMHWVMEFQRRGVPHLHVAAWYDDSAASSKATADWLEITAHLRSLERSQHARPIDGPIGWFQYMAKHCGRGSAHYQRQQKSLPKQWNKCPGVWGKRGDWPIVEPAEGQLTDKQWYRFRRLVRAWRTAEARAQVPGAGWNWQSSTLLSRPVCREMMIAPGLIGTAKKTLRHRLRHLAYVRAMLRCHDSKLSPVRGVSEWIPPHARDQLLKAI